MALGSEGSVQQGALEAQIRNITLLRQAPRSNISYLRNEGRIRKCHEFVPHITYIPIDTPGRRNDGPYAGCSSLPLTFQQLPQLLNGPLLQP